MTENRRVDFALFVTTIMLLMLGIFMVYDASYAVAGQVNKNPAFYIKRQAVSAIVGLIFMFIAMKIPYWKLKKYASTLLYIGIVGLIAVYIPHIGRAAYGKTRWLYLGSVPVQPSEIAKLCLVVYLANYLASRKSLLTDWQAGLLPLVIPVGVVGLLIVKEDMGTCIVLICAAIAMLYAAGVRKSHVGAILGMGVLAGTGFVMIESYRCHRIMAFLNPFKDYHGTGFQICQSLIALGSGGVFGMGLCESRQKLFYLPAEHTDMIYAVFGQETGLVGTVSLILLFLFFTYRGIEIAKNCRDSFGRLLAAGLIILISGQALLNMMVVTGSVPNTGVPLPFISYGGSSLVLNLVSVGILLGISKYPKPSEAYEHEDHNNRRRNRRPRVSRA